jgi:type III pantothenate kinase
MLLAIDIGNSNVSCGLFEQSALKRHWSLSTDPSKTGDEYGVLVLGVLREAGIEPDRITAVVLSSVVPSLTAVIETMADTIFHCRSLVVSTDMETGLTLAYTDPRELGTDRLAAAVAAYARYRTSLIVVDVGTAITFSAVTHSGEYLGGVIAPGIRIAADALAARTARLPRVDLIRPKTVIGRDTRSSIQSGLIFGYAGLVDEIVTRMQQEMGKKALVIATGGLASLVAPESRTITEIRPFLTLEGLELLYHRTCGDA